MARHDGVGVVLLRRERRETQRAQNSSGVAPTATCTSRRGNTTQQEAAEQLWKSRGKREKKTQKKRKSARTLLAMGFPFSQWDGARVMMEARSKRKPSMWYSVTCDGGVVIGCDWDVIEV